MADEVGLVSASPILAGSEDEVLLQALRNVWPILSPDGRQIAINVAEDARQATGEC